MKSASKDENPDRSRHSRGTRRRTTAHQAGRVRQQVERKHGQGNKQDDQTEGETLEEKGLRFQRGKAEVC